MLKPWIGCSEPGQALGSAAEPSGNDAPPVEHEQTLSTADKTDPIKE